MDAVDADERRPLNGCAAGGATGEGNRDNRAADGVRVGDLGVSDGGDVAVDDLRGGM